MISAGPAHFFFVVKSSCLLHPALFSPFFKLINSECGDGLTHKPKGLAAREPSVPNFPLIKVSRHSCLQEGIIELTSQNLLFLL